MFPSCRAHRVDTSVVVSVVASVVQAPLLIQTTQPASDTAVENMEMSPSNFIHVGVLRTDSFGMKLEKSTGLHLPTFTPGGVVLRRGLKLKHRLELSLVLKSLKCDLCLVYLGSFVGLVKFLLKNFCCSMTISRRKHKRSSFWLNSVMLFSVTKSGEFSFLLFLFLLFCHVFSDFC